MQTEFEVKFGNVDHDVIRAKLRDAGAKLQQPMRLMRRYIYDYQDMRLEKKRGYLRLRDEGDKSVLTYKSFGKEHGIDSAQESEVVVSDFDQAHHLLTQLELVPLSFQESKRETWHVNGGEVVLDEWPWLEPFIEIEADGEEGVKNIADMLGFDWQDAKFGDVTTLYKLKYEVSLADFKRSPVRFNDPLPDWIKPKEAA